MCKFREKGEIKIFTKLTSYKKSNAFFFKKKKKYEIDKVSLYIENQNTSKNADAVKMPPCPVFISLPSWGIS